MKFIQSKDNGEILMKVLSGESIPEKVYQDNIDLYSKIEAGVVDAAFEKHVPSYKVEGDKLIVQIGEVEHPMIEEHYIDFILVEYVDGVQIKYLIPGEKPLKEFNAEGARAIYAYCNLHGLWKKEIE